MCYSGKLNEKSEPLSLGLSWVDGKKLYPVYFNLDLWEDATGKDIKLIKGIYLLFQDYQNQIMNNRFQNPKFES